MLPGVGVEQLRRKEVQIAQHGGHLLLSLIKMAMVRSQTKCLLGIPKFRTRRNGGHAKRKGHCNGMPQILMYLLLPLKVYLQLSMRCCARPVSRWMLVHEHLWSRALGTILVR